MKSVQHTNKVTAMVMIDVTLVTRIKKKQMQRKHGIMDTPKPGGYVYNTKKTKNIVTMM